MNDSFDNDGFVTKARSRRILFLSSLRQGYPKREIFRKQSAADAQVVTRR
jgi:hypothetical protein